MKRRKLLKGMLRLAGLSLIPGIYTWQIEPFWLEFVEKKMPIKNLPENLVGKTLMQLSDIHVGGVEDAYLIDSFTKAKNFKPDFVVYTGDFVNYGNAEEINQLEGLFKHAVNGNLGTFGVLGNHDYGHGWKEPKVADNVAKILQDVGINILRNEQVEVDGLNMIGIDDFWSTNYNPQKVMKKYDASKASIALCHNPDACDDPVWNGYQGWILSGHTHGGQCKPPFLDPPIIPVKNRRYTAGEIDLKDGRTLYINRALGNLMQVRFNVRPEITIFELCQA